MAYLYSRCGVDIRRSTPVATNSKIEQSQSATSNNGISVVYSENKVDPSESSHFHFKDNTERSINLVKNFEAKYRECFCNHLTQLITDLENSTSIYHIVDACNCFNNNISNSTYNNTSLNGVTLSVNANIDLENSKNNLITDSKNLLASYQVTVLEKQEKTEPNIELKENNAFFRFFNSVIKLLTKFINFFQQGHMLNKLNDVIDKKKSLNETELANLINQLNQTSLDKALLYSTQQGNVEILNMLVQAKANVNTQNEQHGDTPLILAAEQGNVEIIDLLVQAGANINATNKYNETALNVAIWWHRYDFAKKLLEYQPDVNTTDIKGCTALILATSRVLNNNSNDDILYEIIDEIIDKSSNEALNLQNYRGYNALHGAVSRGNLYAVKKLLKREVLVNDTFKFIFNDNNQGSALHLIIGMYDIDINKKLEIIKLLLDAGIDTNIKDSESRTALELAKLKVRSSQNHKLIVKLLQKNSRHNKLNDVINKTENLNETEVTNLINKLSPDSLGTALIYSADKGNVEILNRLIKAGADVNTKNKFNKTPLIIAATQGNIEIINMLIKAGADINAKDKFNLTALMLAIFKGQYYTAKKLLEYSPDIHDVSTNGNTALTLIAGRKRKLNNNFTDDLLYEVSDALIEESSKETLNHVAYNNNAALHYAVNHSNVHVVKELLKRDVLLNGICKYNADHIGSALHISALSNNLDIKTKIEMIKLLLDAGIDTNLKDGNGRTALEAAKLKASSCQEDYKQIVELLQKNSRHNKLNDVIDKTENLNETELTNLIKKLTPSSLNTALIYSAEKGNVEILNRLLAAGADVNAENKNGFTPLMGAVAQGNIEILNKLIAVGANVHVENKDGFTPLMGAVAQGNIEILNKLIAAGANIDAQNEHGFTPLIKVAEQGNIEILNKLIAVGANVHVENKDGFTPLMGAAAQGNIEIINRLIATRADINAKDKFDQTALMKAVFTGRYYTAKKLIERGASVNNSCKFGSALHVAINSENIDTGKIIEIIKLLLDAEIDTNLKDGNGRTALEAAKLKASSYPASKPIVELLEYHIQN